MNNTEIDINKFLSELILRIIRFVSRHKFKLLISITLGVLTTFSIYFYSKDVYVATLIAKSKVYEPIIVAEPSVDIHISKQLSIDKYDLVLVANSISNYLSDKKKLSKILTLTLEDAKKIKNIEADTILETNYFFIELTYRKGLDLDSLEKGLINYLNTNKLIKTKIDIAKLKNENLIRKIEQEISKLEILQKAIISSKENYTNRNVNIENYTSFYHNDILNLNLLKENLIADNQNLSSVDLSQSFSFINKAKYPLLLVLFSCLIIFVFLGFMYSLIFDLYHKI